MLASTDGSLGSDRLLNIFTDSDMSVLASTDGSRGSVRIHSISTDSDVSVLAGTDGSRGSVIFPGNSWIFLRFLWKFPGIYMEFSWNLCGNFLEILGIFGDLEPLGTIAWNYKHSVHISLPDLRWVANTQVYLQKTVKLFWC